MSTIRARALSLLYSRCDGTNEVRATESLALIPSLRTFIVPTIRPCRRGISLLFADDFNDVHRFRGGRARAGTSAEAPPSLAWLGISGDAHRYKNEVRPNLNPNPNPIISEWSPTT